MNTQFELTLNDYQNGAMVTAIYPGQGTFLGLIYCGLKLAGEAGEVSQKIGKAIRDDDICEMLTGCEVRMRHLSNEKREALKKELGGVLWYVAAAAHELGYALDEIAQTNLDQLASRAARGVLKGSGDER